MSKQITVTAKAPKVDKTGEATVTVGETAKESIELFGDEAVNSNALANATVTVQSGVRRMLTAGKSAEEIQDAFSNWKLGVAIVRVADPTAAIMAKWPTMSKEERAEFLSKLKKSE